MIKKGHVPLLLVLIVSGLLAGCGSKAYTAEKTFNSFIRAVRDGNVEQARKLCHPMFLEREGEYFSEHLAEAQKKLINEIDRIDIVEVTIRGNEAGLTVKYVENDGSTDNEVVSLKNTAGRWLIFDL